MPPSHCIIYNATLRLRFCAVLSAIAIPIWTECVYKAEPVSCSPIVNPTVLSKQFLMC